MSLLATTELEAVNSMLGAIGESPVNSLVNMTSVDAITAYSVLKNVNRSVQIQGWFFNLEKEYTLTPTLDGQLDLPTNTLAMDSSSESPNYEVVQRGLKVYDKKNHTYNFASSLKVDLIVLLSFEEIPEAARTYITTRASRMFQDRTLGSDSLHNFHREDEYQALTTLRLMESENADYNILTGNSSVSRILTR
jgi:hypothetical protein